MSSMRLLYKGMSGDDVLKWQTFLHSQGYKLGNLDADFGGKTDSATRLYQVNNGLIDDGLVGRNTITKAIEDGFKTVSIFVRDVNELIIHITASNDNATVEDIRKGHKDRGFTDIGYHYLVDRAGVVHPGRPEDTVGAHCAGMNAHTLGIAYIARGNDKKSNEPYGTYMTEPQRLSLEKLVAQKLKERKLDEYDVSGHNDHNKGKACPCFRVKLATDFRKNIAALL